MKTILCCLFMYLSSEKNLFIYEVKIFANPIAEVTGKLSECPTYKYAICLPRLKDLHLRNE